MKLYSTMVWQQSALTKLDEMFGELQLTFVSRERFQEFLNFLNNPLTEEQTSKLYEFIQNKEKVVYFNVF